MQSTSLTSKKLLDSLSFRHPNDYTCAVIRGRVFSIIMFAIVALIYLRIAVNIRPIADDYCVAAGVSGGIQSYFLNIVNNWSGDFLQILLSIFLVGVPGSLGLFTVLGITTLILSLVSVLTLVFLIFSQFFGRTKFVDRISFFISINTFLLIFWNLYWSLPASISLGYYHDAFSMPKESFSAVFGWPTVILQYLVIPLGSLILVMTALRAGRDSNAVIAVLGLAIGFSGIVFSVTAIIIIILFKATKVIDFKKSHFITLEIAILTAALISFFLPGSQSRVKILLTPSVDSFGVNFDRWMLNSVLEFATSILNLGVLFVFLSTALLSFIFLDKQLIFLDVRKLNKFLGGMSIFLVFHYLVICISELFTYEAFWHLLTFKSGLFFFAIIFGLRVSLNWRDYRFQSSHSVQVRFLSLFLCFFLTLGIITSFNTNSTLLNRAAVWAKGAAPLPGIADISVEDSWVSLCWKRLQELREFPNRV